MHYFWHVMSLYTAYLSREGTTTQSESEGAVRGDRHFPLNKPVLYNSGFTMKTNTMPDATGTQIGN